MKALKLFAVLVLVVLSAACGGKGGNPIGPDVDGPLTGGVTPTPLVLRIQPGNNFEMRSPGSGVGFTILDIPSSGSLKITIRWAFEDSTIGIALLNQPGCIQTSATGWSTSWNNDIATGTCPTLIGPVLFATDSSRRIEFTRPVSAGRAYLRLSNQRQGSGGESGTVEVVFLP